MSAIIIRLLYLLIGSFITLAIMAIVTIGKQNELPSFPRHLTLREFVEKFVGHNTIVYLYREEYKVTDGVVTRYRYKVGVFMDWQISYSKDDESYFIAHPEVEKCKYINAPVAKIIGKENAEVDEVAIVIYAKEAENNERRMDN